MVKEIESVFPRLGDGNYQVTSPRADTYNCIAWAAGDTTAWWWPEESDSPDIVHWPLGVPRVQTLDAFCQAFATLGYVVCGSETLEAGFEKIALFADAKGVPLHAARQLPSGRWTSKLGPMEDIEHALHDLTGVLYGAVVLFMKRLLAPSNAGSDSPVV